LHLLGNSPAPQLAQQQVRNNANPSKFDLGKNQNFLSPHLNFNQTPPSTTQASSSFHFDQTQTITQHFGNISINDPLQAPEA
jgi:hypothetical protein